MLIVAFLQFFDAPKNRQG